MEALKLVIVAALIVTLLRPELVYRSNRRERPQFAVLYDASASMATLDMETDTGVAQRIDWIRAQHERDAWQPLRANADVSVEPFAVASALTNLQAGATNNAFWKFDDKPVITDDEGTDIDSALTDALNRYRNLKAVLLISDGDWNEGPPPIGAAWSLNAFSRKTTVELSGEMS